MIFIRARHAAARVAPVKGYLAGSNTEEPRGSAPRERDHRGGDHPVPSRTRQLSPPSPRVLQRKAAGGQGVALAEGAFLFARAAREETRGMRRTRREGPQGDRPLAGLFAFGGCRGLARRTRREGPQGNTLCGPFRVLMGFGPPSPSREERWRDCSEVFPCEPLRVFVRRSCSGAGFGRAACAGRIRCTRPARLGTRRKARARARVRGPADPSASSGEVFALWEFLCAPLCEGRRRARSEVARAGSFVLSGRVHRIRPATPCALK